MARRSTGLHGFTMAWAHSAQIQLSQQEQFPHVLQESVLGTVAVFWLNLNHCYGMQAGMHAAWRNCCSFVSCTDTGPSLKIMYHGGLHERA